MENTDDVYGTTPEIRKKIQLKMYQKIFFH